MVNRQCYKCKATFDKKSTYDYHMNRKTDCSLNNIYSNDLNNVNLNICENLPEFAKNCENQKNNEIFSKNSNSPKISDSDLTKIDTDNSDFFCSYCNKKYSSKYTLSRHMNDVCKAKKDCDIEKENIFKLLLEKDKLKEIEINELKKQNKLFEEQNKKFEKQNKLLMDKIDKLINIKEHSKSLKIINDNKTITNDNKTITNNLSNSNNNTQNNFVMVNFGKEDLSIIDEKLFIDRIIKKNTISGVKIPDEVLKIIHFNPMYPQLSNIYISDINREKCMVWEDGEWILSNIDNIPQIMDKICLFSSEQINILREKYPNSKALNDRLNVIEKYNNMIDEDYIQDLREQDDYNYNKLLIKRAEDFQKLAYDTIKKTLYNEGKKLKKIIKQN